MPDRSATRSVSGVGIAADQHLVLVGLMGSGKTTVARIAAERLGRKIIDSDAVIERATGRTVRQIFADDGEDAFRSLETAALLDALADPVPAVIAAAGGVVLREQNRIALEAGQRSCRLAVRHARASWSGE